VAWSGEAGHVGADLGERVLGGGDADAGDLIELGDLGGVRGDGLADPGGEGIDLGGGRVDPGQHHARHEGVVIGEVPGQRLLQDAGLGAHVLAGQASQLVRVALPADQGGEHVPAGGAEDVADYRGQFDLGVFE
jgi:hypothetical protein